MEDKVILALLFKDNVLRTCLLDNIEYICNTDVANNLLRTSTKYFSDRDKSLSVTYDDLNAVFYSEFEENSEEINLWNEIKNLEFSDIDTIKGLTIKHINKKLKEYFFAEAFSDDCYDLDKLENLYSLLYEIGHCDNNDNKIVEDLFLDDIDGCCNDYDNQKLEGVKFFDERISNSLSAKQFDCGTVNVIMGAPGRGKTQLILNQGVYVANNEQYTLHVAIGDLTKRQLLLRILAITTQKPIQQISMLNKDQFKTFLTKAKEKYPNVFKHLHCKVCLPNTLTSLDLIRKIEEMQRKRNVHYTQIVIDYDGNIETDISTNNKKKDDDSKSMYYAGADIYNNFVSFAKRNNTVVWILSQPKVQYWSQEKIPLEALSDSSKKGHIVDFCLSIGKKDVTEDQCTFFCSKNRHGEANKTYYSKQIGSTQTFEKIEAADW